MEKKIEALQKVLKTLKEKHNIVKKKKNKQLHEILRQYPNEGINFKVSQKFWPEDKYYVVKSIQKLSFNDWVIYGHKYENGVKVQEEAIEIEDQHKTNLWNHQPGDDKVILDNGMVFTRKDFELYHKLNYPVKKGDVYLDQFILLINFIRKSGKYNATALATILGRFQERYKNDSQYRDYYEQDGLRRKLVCCYRHYRNVNEQRNDLCSLRIEKTEVKTTEIRFKRITGEQYTYLQRKFEVNCILFGRQCLEKQDMLRKYISNN